MKRIVVLLLSFTFSLFAVEWKTYQEAQIEQKITNKIIMIDVIRSSCHYCSDMEKAVFQDKEMSAWIKEKFIPVKINLDHDLLPLKLKVRLTPTFYFIDKNNEIIKKIPGSWTKEDFKSLTERIQ